MRTREAGREAGRELDMRVAVAMGWTGIDPEFRGPRGEHWFVPSGIAPNGGHRREIPQFSKDIGTAFKWAVAWMADNAPVRFKNLWLVAYCYDRTYATFDAEKGASREDWTEANGEHATPLAICLAALDALDAASPAERSSETHPSLPSDLTPNTTQENSPMMRAKFSVQSVTPYGEPVTHETVHMMPVSGKAPYGKDGESEDNTFARYTPSGSLSLTINNPALLGKFTVGQKFYADFTEAGE